MNDSQCLDDLPIVSRWCGAARQELGLREFYSETQRLALEELISGGEEAYSALLKRERVQGFLSADEIASILQSTISPPGLDSQPLEQSFTCSSDLSSGTYFPDASDIEVPVLDIGWPVYPSNWYRGVTQVEVYFQPSYGELIYSCKEAIRKLIRKAEKVIALVMDNFTDIDILKDLHEACRRRRVPVYILLDQFGLPLFQKMCRDAGVRVEEERKMRVRTITGCTYCTRTGAKVIGRVHEKFMLIDCDKVATGSYSFTWTDGKLNRSNLTVLSGQLSEFYDEEFRILYAQSQLIPNQSADFRHRAICGEIAAKKLVSREPTASTALEKQIVPCSPVNCKPEGLGQTAEKKLCSQTSVGSAGSHVSEVSTLSDKASHQTEMKSVSVQTDVQVQTGMQSTSTQTCILLKEVETQTTFLSKSSSTQTSVCSRIGAQAVNITDAVPLSLSEQSDTDGYPAIGKSTNTPDQPPHSPSESSNGSCSSSSSATSEGRQCHTFASYHHAGLHSTNSTLRNCFQKLTKERQFHYTTIRSKLDSMVAILSRNRQLDKFDSRELGHYGARGSRELLSRSRVLGFREVSALASLALRN